MLEYLHIRDVATIRDVELEFGPGLNVVTGETGAGKSLLLQSLTLLRGGRADSGLVRSGSDRAVVEAVFRVPEHLRRRLADFEGYPGEEELVVTRIVAPGGRGRVRVNGELATVALLERWVAPMVDLTSQRQQQALAEPVAHRRLVDRFGVAPELLQGYRAAWHALRDLCRKLDELPTDADERRIRREILEHQLQELEGARLQPGEEEELDRERRRLAAATEVRQVLEDSVSGLYEQEGAAVEVLGALERRLERLGDLDGRLAELAGRLAELRAGIEDVAFEARQLVGDYDVDPARLEEVERRRSELADLKRKHRCATVSDLVARQVELARELESLLAFERETERLDAALDQARSAVAEAAERLTEARRTAAGALQEAVTRQLRDLGMPHAVFHVAVESQAARTGDDPRFVYGTRRAGPWGWDRVQFLVAPNPGEPPRPIQEVASGGELSRLLLAIKTVVAASDEVAVSVFDEVDSGVGGGVAAAVGAKLADVARHRQVICVTHLPQIAAHADRHFRVDKTVDTGQTESRVWLLEGRDRLRELARMLGGDPGDSKSLAYAEQLVRKARRPAGGRESARQGRRRGKRRS